MTDSNRQKHDALKGLARPLRVTRLGMLAERALRSFWLLWTVLVFGLALLMLGLQDFIAPKAAQIMLLAFGLAAIYGLIYGLRRFRWPSKSEARARLDASLAGHPITALTDTQAVGAQDLASKAVWQAHLARITARLKRAKAAPADLQISRYDPYAFRYMALLLLLVALIFGSVARVASVVEIASGQGGAAQAAAPSWEGWIAPPAYTGKPSLYLNDLPAGDLLVPKGARITVRLYGEAGALTLHETVSGEAGDETGPDAVRHEMTVNQAGILQIDGQGGVGWNIALLPDLSPEVRFDGDLLREASGVMRQPFAAQDDYAVVSGQAEFRLDLANLDRRYGQAAPPEPRENVILDLPLPFAGDRRKFSEDLVDDLSKHPWSGLPVTLTLTVQDAQGQIGNSAAKPMLMPGRRFFAPLAAAVIEQRRDLLWSRQNAARVTQVLRAVTHRPDGFVRNDSAYLMLRVAIRRLESGVAFNMTTELQNEIADALWEIALLFEDGSLADAKQRLKRAQERLSEAMKNGASKDEIAELMDELRDATKDYMNQLAEQQGKDGSENQQQAQKGDTFKFSQQELQALMDRIQELMEEGRMEEAQELMQRMNEMMENLRITEGGQGGEQGEGQQSMQNLKDSLRDQQGLSDEAFRDLQEQFNPDAQAGEGDQNRSNNDGRGQGDGESGQQGGKQGKQSLADRQQALRDELQRQQGALPGAGTAEGDAARQNLDKAGRAMDKAEQALRDDRLAEALDNQAEALEAMREGLRNLNDAIARNEQQQSPGEQGQSMGRDSANARDPLGRSNGGRGQAGSDESLLQGQDVYRRARELLDELRRRSGDQNRPDVELDYLKRLLDRF
ncbi:MAG TPA: TIGR02302 family protein [Rhodobacteraceae bacterium]|jgi:uncharacterized protein (TIGR02302 family)|nr:TIGR02302 family protein [Paracoccaceae bacterium]